jgi:hypothetical protein
MTEPPTWPAPGSGDPSSGYGPPPPAPPPPPPAYPGAAPNQGWQPSGYGSGYGSGPGSGHGYGAPGGFAQPYAVAAPKPGIIPLRPLTVGEILDGAFSTLRRHPKATLGLSAVVACIQQALTLGVRAGLGTLDTSAGFLGTTSGTSVAVNLTGTLLSLAISLVLGLALTGMLCLVVSDSILGRPTSAGAAWQRARPMLGRIVLAAIAVGILEALGFVACILPGIFLWAALALTLPALVLERTTVGQAIRRSWRLVLPSFWRTLGIRILGQIIAGAIAVPFSLVLAAVTIGTLRATESSSDHLSAWAIALSAVVGVAVTTVTAPFLAGLITLLYVDRRIRAEGLDMQLQQAAARTASEHSGSGFS